MSIDFGRMGELNGVFVCEKQELVDLIASEKEIYFGEVLGKHSEIYEVMRDGYFEEVTTDANFIELFEKYGLSNGYNPFDYLEG